MKQVAWNKSSLLLNIILQNTQTLQLNLNVSYLQRVFKIPSEESLGWIDRESNKRKSTCALIESGVGKLS